MSDAKPHVFTATKDFPKWGRGKKITATACLHQLGNQRPYFSVTCDVWGVYFGKRSSSGGGCMHKEILAKWPKLAPVVALHLSDDTGTPMHAEANGWYHLAGFYGGAFERYHAGNNEGNLPRETTGARNATEYRYPTPDECLKLFADHVRISVEQARELAEMWRGATPEASPDWSIVRMAYGAWMLAQASRWQAEADAAVALLDTLAAREVEA